MIPWIIVGLLIVGALIVRFAPSDAARWHQPVRAEADKRLKGGAIAVRRAQSETLEQVDARARQLPRTKVLAGSVDEGHVTYVSRSKVFGFPDYTTVQQDAESLKVYARLRFGRRDFGVNNRRVRQLLSEPE